MYHVYILVKSLILIVLYNAFCPFIAYLEEFFLKKLSHFLFI